MDHFVLFSGKVGLQEVLGSGAAYHVSQQVVVFVLGLSQLREGEVVFFLGSLHFEEFGLQL